MPDADDRAERRRERALEALREKHLAERHAWVGRRMGEEMLKVLDELQQASGLGEGPGPKVLVVDEAGPVDPRVWQNVRRDREARERAALGAVDERDALRRIERASVSLLWARQSDLPPGVDFMGIDHRTLKPRYRVKARGVRIAEPLREPKRAPLSWGRPVPWLLDRGPGDDATGLEHRGG